MDESGIRKLRDLTGALPRIPADAVQNYSRFKTENGTIETWGLLRREDIIVFESSGPGGVVLPRHSQGAIEVMVVYDGEMEVEAGDKKKKLHRGDVITMLPGEPHHVRYLTNCRLIVISIPATGGVRNGSGA